MTTTTTRFANLTFVTPPRNQGQMVTISYAADADNGLLVERTTRPDGPTVYRTADFDDSDMAGVEFEPWNCAPAVPEDMWDDVNGSNGAKACIARGIVDPPVE